MQKVEMKKLKIDLRWLQWIKNWVELELIKKRKKKQKLVAKIKDDNFIGLIHRAKIDLEQSKNFFSKVTDPDLIDYASYEILANQSFYTYLIKKAKAENITFHV